MAEISVIMPVYNSGKFLQQAVNSILNQSFTDFEFLICDDCSTDDSAEILQNAAARDSRIKLLKNESNRGISFTTNRLCEAASTPLLARMDADDIALPDRLQKQYDFLQEHPEVAAVGGNLEIIDEENNIIGRRYYLQNPEDIRKAVLCGSPLAHPTVIIRKKTIDQLGGYDNNSNCEDYDLWLRITGAGYALANLPDTVLRYRLSPTQFKQRKMKKGLLATIELQRKYLFRKEFFSLKALVYFMAEHILLLLPNKLVLAIFKKVTYK